MYGRTIFIPIKREIINWGDDVITTTVPGQGGLYARPSSLYGFYENKLVRMRYDHIRRPQYCLVRFVTQLPPIPPTVTDLTRDARFVTLSLVPFPKAIRAREQQAAMDSFLPMLVQRWSRQV